MPLMRDWSDALCEALDERESNLARACHLLPGMEGPEFEENLGLLLRWQQVRHLEKRFHGLGGAAPGHIHQQVIKAGQKGDERLELVMEAINRTLYDQFAQHRVDDARAEEAFGRILKEMGKPDLIFATTNYDRAGESALAALGHQIDAGFRGRPLRSPILEPLELVSEENTKTPAIHLHGAVGWYERDGSVIEHHPDQPFNPTLGTPVVLYPDPEKDPTSDAVVSELWAEFNKALEIAWAVLVIGHSLHDPALVRALKRIASSKPVVISFLGTDGEERVTRMVPDSIPIELEFGPETQANEEAHSVLKCFREPELLEAIARGRRRANRERKATSA